MGIVIFCNNCDHLYTSFYGATRYIFDNNGNKVVCGSHTHIDTYQAVLGDSYTDEMLQSRLGFSYPMVCEKCCHEFQLDKERENKICPSCHSLAVRDIYELVGAECPFCKSGRVSSKTNFSVF